MDREHRPSADRERRAGLCGLGASSKIDTTGNRRASIGHKGLGFKSVLEVTDEPTVYSRTHSFKLGARYARPRRGRAVGVSSDARRPARCRRCGSRSRSPRRTRAGPTTPPTASTPRSASRSGIRSTPSLGSRSPTCSWAAAHNRAVPEAPRVGRGARRSDGPARTRTWLVQRERLDETGSAWAPSTGFRGSGRLPRVRGQ